MNVLTHVEPEAMELYTDIKIYSRYSLRNAYSESMIDISVYSTYMHNTIRHYDSGMIDANIDNVVKEYLRTRTYTRILENLFDGVVHKLGKNVELMVLYETLFPETTLGPGVGILIKPVIFLDRYGENTSFGSVLFMEGGLAFSLDGFATDLSVIVFHAVPDKLVSDLYDSVATRFKETIDNVRRDIMEQDCLFIDEVGINDKNVILQTVFDDFINNIDCEEFKSYVKSYVVNGTDIELNASCEKPIFDIVAYSSIMHEQIITQDDMKVVNVVVPVAKFTPRSKYTLESMFSNHTFLPCTVGLNARLYDHAYSEFAYTMISQSIFIFILDSIYVVLEEGSTVVMDIAKYIATKKSDMFITTSKFHTIMFMDPLFAHIHFTEYLNPNTYFPVISEINLDSRDLKFLLARTSYFKNNIIALLPNQLSDDALIYSDERHILAMWRDDALKRTKRGGTFTLTVNEDWMELV